MSDSGDDPPLEDSTAQKRRKMQRACDICRRKKIKCEGGNRADKKCNNCAAYNDNCTYLEAAKKRRHARGYVESLEQRLAKTEALLNKMMGTSTIGKELNADDPQFPEFTPDKLDPSWFRFKANAEGHVKVASAVVRSFPQNARSDGDSSDEEEAWLQRGMVEDMRRMNLDNSELRFVGRSSGLGLLHSTVKLRESLQDSHPQDAMNHKRPQYWTRLKWEIPEVEPYTSASFSFPEPALMVSLIDLYFMHSNIFIPILHRPTFQQNLKEGLHHSSKGFAATLLCVCAIGARFSTDPRVYLENVENFEQSGGWKWFVQVRRHELFLLESVTVYDLQECALAVLYMQSCSMPQVCWITIGTGIRMAQDAGSHRKSMFGAQAKSRAEQELWKRAFWCLVYLDRTASLGLGRPCAIQDEDIDVDYPTACDDEYWYTENAEDAFVQPTGTPSTMDYFISLLDLNQILGFCMRTIYSLGKSRSALGFSGNEWKKHLVTELDSALNKWVDSIPDHIRWDPHRQNDVFFSQSVLLYCSYYHLQILTHRPFITIMPKRSTESSLFPSLAICTNAARAISHITDCQFHRTGTPRSTHLCTIPIFSSAIVLLLNLWSGKRSGLSFNAKNEMADVYKCMKPLRALEKSWNFAGRLWDILYELSFVGELPLPRSPTHKRELDADSPKTDASSPGPATTEQSTLSQSRPISHNKRARTVTQPTFTLPIGRELSNPTSFEPVVPPSGDVCTDFQSSFLTQMCTYSEQAPDTPVVPPPPHPWTQDLHREPLPLDTLMSYSQPRASSSTSTLSSLHSNYDTYMHSSASSYGAAASEQHYPPHQSHAGAQAPAMLLDTDTFGMWPTGFELEDWGQYLNNLTHGPGPDPT